MSDKTVQIKKINDNQWEIPREGGMHVPGILYADESMIGAIKADQSAKQVATRLIAASITPRGASGGSD